MHAVAILLRGSLVSPALVLIQAQLHEWYGHVAILLSDGRVVEASALHNEVLVHKHDCEWWNYEKVLSLDHLGLEAQQEIARIAIAMQGWKYDWRNAKGHALTMNVWDDPRRVLCFELVAIATCKFLRYGKPPSKVDATEIARSWRWSRVRQRGRTDEMTDFETKLQALLILHEGEVLHTYKCSAGKVTIGVGHNLEANPIHGLSAGSTITQERSREILESDLAAVLSGLKKHLPWVESLDEVRRAVLIDMCFNLGIWGLLGFKNTLAAIESGEFVKASAMMLQSKWAGQVGKRAIRLSTMMNTGEWP